MRKLILCEKPSVARDFAYALGGVKKDGYFESKDFFITYAYGHLLEIDDSNVPKEWSFDVLPIIPSFSLRPKNEKCKKQLGVIKNLLQKVEEVIVATDPGREGQLIAEHVLNYLQFKGKVKRFWTSEALTPDVIKKNLNELRDNSEFKSLYYCALARQRADWLVGVNLTRAFTAKVRDFGGKGVWSVGRVQTPTLFFLYQKAKERENFKPTPYGVVYANFYVPKATRGYLLAEKVSDETTSNKARDVVLAKTEDEEEEDKSFRLSVERAKKIVEELKEEKFGVVESFYVKSCVERPPLLHSLTSLQREANKRYGFTAEKTLNLAQALYEKKLISYPRTDARYLARSSKALVVSVLKKLGREDLVPYVEKREYVFDDSKLTDHFAIIPFAPLSSEKRVTPDEKKVYDLILIAFLGTFYPDFVYKKVSAVVKVKEYPFLLQGRLVVEPGWKVLYEKVEDTWGGSTLRKGERVPFDGLTFEKRETKPPPLHSEASLLKLMERNNLGTPATRASILETLKKRFFARLSKKKITISKKGVFLVESLKETPLTSPEVTSVWEEKLENVYKKNLGYAGYQKFVEEIKKFVVDNLNVIKNLDASNVKKLLLEENANAKNVSTRTRNVKSTDVKKARVKGVKKSARLRRGLKKWSLKEKGSFKVKKWWKQ